VTRKDFIWQYMGKLSFQYMEINRRLLLQKRTWKGSMWRSNDFITIWRDGLYGDEEEDFIALLG
jgi:hypothetical protein